MSPHRAVEPDVFAAIGDARRRRILELLAERDHAVGELATALGIAQPSVTQHLAVLRDTGLVTITRRGTSSICALDRSGFAAVEDWTRRLGQAGDIQ